MLRTLWTVIALEAVAIALLGFLHLQRPDVPFEEKAVFGHSENEGGASRLGHGFHGAKKGLATQKRRSNGPDLWRFRWRMAILIAG